MDIILVHLGSDLPDHFMDCVNQIRKYTDDRIIIYAPGCRHNIPRHWRKDNILHLRNINRTYNWNRFSAYQFLSVYGLNDFWRYAAERLFVVEAIMKAMNIPIALHLENDNLIYFHPDWNYLHEYCGYGIGLTRINESLLSAGIMYIGSVEALELMNKNIVDNMVLGREELMGLYRIDMVNEMHLLHLAAEKYPDRIKCLPSLPEDDSINLLYDCASWGQFVGGTFQTPDIPFAHDSHIIGRKINAGEYTCRCAEGDGSKVPIVINKLTGRIKPLFNLHIHSKNLARWRS